jgi:hypothetical protein
MIAVTKHHEVEVYKAFQAGYDEAREAYDGTGPDAEYEDEDYEEVGDETNGINPNA